MFFIHGPPVFSILGGNGVYVAKYSTAFVGKFTLSVTLGHSAWLIHAA